MTYSSKNITSYTAGTHLNQLEYKSFSPTDLCQAWKIDDPKLNQLLSDANRYIGALDAYSFLIPDVDYFIRMHIAKEATTSSKIEGTQTSLEETFLQQTDIDPEKRDDWQEVDNYVKAMNHAISALDDLPLSSRLIRETHRLLLDGARGKQKLPGQFRTSQNWIGGSLANATFIPPVHTEIADLMNDLEKFMNAEILELDIHVPHLVKIAMIHYQFETIHPFLDGNGRIGRLMITLYLMDKQLLSKPTLYLSDYFEQYRRDYYDKLTEVRTHDDLLGWLQFFLIGVIKTAKKSIATFQAIINLREEIRSKILPAMGKQQAQASKLIIYLYGQPLVSSKDVATYLDIHASTANRLINVLADKGVLVEKTGQKRNRMFVFDRYIQLFK